MDKEEVRSKILGELLDEDLRSVFTVEEACALQMLRGPKPKTDENGFELGSLAARDPERFSYLAKKTPRKGKRS